MSDDHKIAWIKEAMTVICDELRKHSHPHDVLVIVNTLALTNLYINGMPVHPKFTPLPFDVTFINAVVRALEARTREWITHRNQQPAPQSAGNPQPPMQPPMQPPLGQRNYQQVSGTQNALSASGGVVPGATYQSSAYQEPSSSQSLFTQPAPQPPMQGGFGANQVPEVGQTQAAPYVTPDRQRFTDPYSNMYNTPPAYQQSQQTTSLTGVFGSAAEIAQAFAMEKTTPGTRSTITSSRKSVTNSWPKDRLLDYN